MRKETPVCIVCLLPDDLHEWRGTLTEGKGFEALEQDVTVNVCGSCTEHVKAVAYLRATAVIRSLRRKST